MLQLIMRNDRKQVKNSAKVGVSKVIILSASGGCAPVVSRGKTPGQVVRCEADSIMTFETPTLALFFTCFLSFLVINCDTKTVANRYYNAS